MCTFIDCDCCEVKEGKYYALYEHALHLYLNEDKPDEALRILFKLAKDRYVEAYSMIGVILYWEMQDIEKAEEWFVEAENNRALCVYGYYAYGVLHYLQKRDWQSGLKYLLKAAAQEYELAYGDIGTILYLYELDIDQAERWFEKAVDAEALLAPAAYHYGQLLMLERNEWEKSKKYFKQSAKEGFEPAFEVIRLISRCWGPMERSVTSSIGWRTSRSS